MRLLRPTDYRSAYSTKQKPRTEHTAPPVWSTSARASTSALTGQQFRRRSRTSTPRNADHLISVLASGEAAPRSWAPAGSVNVTPKPPTIYALISPCSNKWRTLGKLVARLHHQVSTIQTVSADRLHRYDTRPHEHPASAD